MKLVSPGFFQCGVFWLCVGIFMFDLQSGAFLVTVVVASVLNVL